MVSRFRKDMGIHYSHTVFVRFAWQRLYNPNTHSTYKQVQQSTTAMRRRDSNQDALIDPQLLAIAMIQRLGDQSFLRSPAATIVAVGHASIK
jgi:hypothetical protein